MKIIPILKKIESKKTSVKSKNKFHSKVSKGDFVSIVYYDIEKEQVRLQQFNGLCTKVRSNGFSSKIHLQNILNRVVVSQQFFIYSKSVVDVAILRRKQM